MLQLVTILVVLFALIVDATYALAPFASESQAQKVMKTKPKSYNHTFSFDDIATSSPISNITHYHNLHFQSLHLINGTLAASTGTINRNDTRCARSSPNFLTGNRASNPRVWPRISLEPDTAAAAGIAPVFNLHGFFLRPMNYTHPYTIITVEAYGIIDGEIKTHYNMISGNLRGGNLPGIFVPASKLWPGWGRGVNMFEIYATDQTGECGGDWDICVDDIDVEFLAEDDEVMGMLGEGRGRGLVWETSETFWE